jgi:hypothetical protein
LQEQPDLVSTKVTFVDPTKMFGAFMAGEHDDWSEIAEVANTRLRKALDLLN